MDRLLAGDRASPSPGRPPPHQPGKHASNLGLHEEDHPMTTLQVLSLHFGRSRQPLAWVVPDEKYPQMYRVHWPDGDTSDMVNLTRGRWAAVSICLRTAPSHDRRLFNWRAGRRRSGPSLVR